MTKDGYVYVLINESMPGIVKIGRSSKGGKQRAVELYKNATGVPTAFKMVFEFWSENCIELESTVHEELGPYRLNSCREFFTISANEAIEAIINVFAYSIDREISKPEETIYSHDLMPSYGPGSEHLCKELFPNESMESILKNSIAYHLTQDEVNRAIIEYYYFINRSNKHALTESGIDHLSMH